MKYTSATPSENCATGSIRRRSGQLPPLSKALILCFALIAGTAGAWLTLASSPASLQEALEAQRALVAAHPEDVDLLNDFGNLLGLAGHLEEAEETYRKALALEPRNVTSLYNLALVLQEQGRRKEARQQLETVLEIDPRHAWAHYQLGTLYAARKNRERALDHYATAFALDRSLSLPQVNPHVVENRLLTAALLQMYVSESPSTQAPRLYQQPGDVADLLMPEPEPSPAETPAEMPAETPTQVVPRRYRASFGTPAAEETGDDRGATESGSTAEGGTRVLDESSFRRGSYLPPAESSTSSESEQPSTALDPRFPRSSSGSKGSGIDPGSSGFDSAPGGSPGDFGGSRSFLPGVQSTGHLEIELLPAARSDSRVRSG